MLKKIVDPALPVIKKMVKDRDVSARGAFAAGNVITFFVETPRRLGASAVVLRLCRDGDADRDMPLTFVKTEGGIDRYTLSLDTGKLCGDAEEGLFFYEFLFLRGEHTLFTSTHNQVDFQLETTSSRRFVLLLHKRDFAPPTWTRGQILYQIFVDRFCRGTGAVATRDDAVMNEDWEGGIPQHASKRGEPLKNNEFFGGNLWGVIEKLDYLKSLGVGILYLNPIFRAYSNHKYDTGNYLEIDGMFGGEEAFRLLLERAHDIGIRVILDGVFNHTGDNSLYFDRYGEYGGHGAYTDPSSPYRDWFCFRTYPREYESWWGIDILPKLNLQNDACRSFFVGRDGVCAHYMKMGIDGWRLDVADELTDPFLDQLRRTVKETSNGEGFIIGEVWENAALKEAYGARRRYLQGEQLDSVMNYPLRNGILQFLTEGDGEFLGDILKEIYATYPKCVCDSLMNLLGTHDTERILTVLGEENEPDVEIREDQLATKHLTREERARGIARLKVAATIQFTVYGIPSIFYGDEAGIEGYHDPFCRRPYPWGSEERSLVDFYRILGKIRRSHPVFEDGDFRVLTAQESVIAYLREGRGERLLILANAAEHEIPYPMKGRATDLLTGERYLGVIPPCRALILQFENRKDVKNGTV